MNPVADMAGFKGGRSLWQDAFVRLRRNKLAVAGFIVLLGMGLLSLLAGWISPYSYETQDLMLGAPRSG